MTYASWSSSRTERSAPERAIRAGALHAEVCIIGAGPGGTSAALLLAKHGADAVLVDKAVFPPRDKVCGDALSGKVMRALERLEPSLATALRQLPAKCRSWGVAFTAPNGRTVRVPFSPANGRAEAPGVIFPRMEFDQFMLNAVKNGGRLR